MLQKDLQHSKHLLVKIELIANNDYQLKYSIRKIDIEYTFSGNSFLID